jgi:beta-galactosidase/beta-glucuronidase
MEMVTANLVREGVNKHKARELAEHFYSLAPAAQPAPTVQEPVALEEYDAGLLNDYGGGNVEWWQDYIRAELGRAYEHYQSQIATPPAQPAVPDAMTSADIQEHIEYVAGWNDCRQAMLEMMK